MSRASKTYLAVVAHDNLSGYAHDIYPSERERDKRDLETEGYQIIGEFASAADATVAIKGWLKEHR